MKSLETCGIKDAGHQQDRVRPEGPGLPHPGSGGSAKWGSILYRI
jgi:hypothetical protein